MNLKIICDALNNMSQKDRSRERVFIDGTPYRTDELPILGDDDVVSGSNVFTWDDQHMIVQNFSNGLYEIVPRPMEI